MRELRSLLTFLVSIAVLVLFVWAFFAAALFFVALLSPVLGLVWCAACLRRARFVWTSRGRFTLPDGTIRMIEPARAKGLALAELLSGLGAVGMTLAPTFFFFGPHDALWPALAAGAVLIFLSALLRRRLEAGARPVDVLPKS